MAENFTASQNLTQVSEIASYARVFDQLADVAAYGSAARSIVTRSLVDLSTLAN